MSFGKCMILCGGPAASSTKIVGKLWFLDLEMLKVEVSIYPPGPRMQSSQMKVGRLGFPLQKNGSYSWWWRLHPGWGLVPSWSCEFREFPCFLGLAHLRVGWHLATFTCSVYHRPGISQWSTWWFGARFGFKPPGPKPPIFTHYSWSKQKIHAFFLWRGTLPVILSLIPLALTGSFYLRRDESEVCRGCKQTACVDPMISSTTDGSSQVWARAGNLMWLEFEHIPMIYWLVVSNIFYFHPYLG